MPSINTLESKYFWSLLYVLITIILLFSYSFSNTYRSGKNTSEYFLQFHETIYYKTDIAYLKCLEKLPARKKIDSHKISDLLKKLDEDIREGELCPMPSTTKLAPNKIIFNLFVFSLFPGLIIFLILLKREHSHNK